MRPAPPVLRHQVPPSQPAPMYGRNIQISDARRAIQGAAAIGFHARCGFGVSTLLRHIAASDFAQATGLPVARLRAGRGPVADVLQRLVDQLYVSEQRTRLTDPETAQVLGQFQAVVILDDVAVSAEEAGYILAVLPRCSIVLGSLRPVFGCVGRKGDRRLPRSTCNPQASPRPQLRHG